MNKELPAGIGLFILVNIMSIVLNQSIEDYSLNYFIFMFFSGIIITLSVFYITYGILHLKRVIKWDKNHVKIKLSKKQAFYGILGAMLAYLIIGIFIGLELAESLANETFLEDLVICAAGIIGMFTGCVIIYLTRKDVRKFCKKLLNKSKTLNNIK